MPNIIGRSRPRLEKTEKTVNGYEKPEECERLRKLALADAGGATPEPFEDFGHPTNGMDSLAAHHSYLERPRCTPMGGTT